MKKELKRGTSTLSHYKMEEFPFYAYTRRDAKRKFRELQLVFLLDIYQDCTLIGDKHGEPYTMNGTYGSVRGV
ncbi:hypothetical protein [Sporosarcina sp. FSL K6-3508]|uniref:hypothetical protein n=1 Tax=Sporosarcina sp. FSL K6-3508 TaxID=2921557 RepID=UPI00315A9E53